MHTNEAPPAQYYKMEANYQYQHYSAKKVDSYYVKDEKGQYKSKPSVLLSNKPLEEIKGRRIIGYSFNLGSSGGYPGDPKGLGRGFFGFLLQPNNNELNKEWMVVTIASAPTHHVLLDSRWVRSSYSAMTLFKPKREPWFIQGRGLSIQKDNLASLIDGCIVTNIVLEQDSCKIDLEKDGQKHLLEILNTDPRLCPWPGAQYKVGKETRYALPKAFKEGTDQIGNYIIFMEEKGEIYV